MGKKNEIQTMVDVYQHIEAITKICVKKHMLLFADSLIDGRHVFEIFNRAPMAIVHERSGVVLYHIHRGLFDNEGNRIPCEAGVEVPAVNLYDETGKLIVGKHRFSQNPDLIFAVDNFYSIRQFMPVFITNVIHDVCCYPGSKPNQSEMLKFLEPEYRDLDWLEAIKCNLTELRQEIVKLIQPHAWSVHYVRSNKDGSISIERGFDWRIIRYYEEEFADQEED